MSLKAARNSVWYRSEHSPTTLSSRQKCLLNHVWPTSNRTKFQVSRQHQLNSTSPPEVNIFPAALIPATPPTNPCPIERILRSWSVCVHQHSGSFDGASLRMAKGSCAGCVSMKVHARDKLYISRSKRRKSEAVNDYPLKNTLPSIIPIMMMMMTSKFAPGTLQVIFGNPRFAEAGGMRWTTTIISSIHHHLHGI